MPVSDQHKEYKKYIKRVNQIRDCVEGADAIKNRGGGEYAGSVYLPVPEPVEDHRRYDAYKKRANYVNFTGQTKDGMLGMVFRKEIKAELPDSINYLVDNATGGGLSLEQLTIDVMGDSLETGKYGLLVDYPETDGNLTQAEVNRMGLQAALLPYPFESIINWRTSVINGRKMLSLVVLHETVEKVGADGFTCEPQDQYRVLRLTDGVYTQQIYDKDNLPVTDEFTPRKFNGSAWDHIPFVVIGAQNNDESTDKPPLYDISEINIAHYRNSADYEESCFMVGQPTPVFAGLNQSWADEYMKEGVYLGSRKAVLLPVGATAELLQAESNQMPLEGMREKELQLIKLGARIIQDSSGNETAEAARIRFGGQNSRLGVIVTNVESGIIQALEWAMEFMGGDGEIVFALNREFYDKSLDAQQVMALITLADRQDITGEELRDALRRGNWITKEDDEIDLANETRGFNLEAEVELER